MSPDLASTRTYTHPLIDAKNRHMVYSTINILGFFHGDWSKNGYVSLGVPRKDQF